MAGIEDGYEARFNAAEVAALRLTDALIGRPAPPSESDQHAVLRAFGPDGVMELMLGVGLFLGMSKVLITLGLEPESMPISVLPAPGSNT
ncbi:MAG: hypothetical protein ACKOBM_01855 [Gammaproteobacteria bacterium]